MSEITAIWERIEAWYERHGASHLLNPGASEGDIAQLEERLGHQIPDDLKQSLQRHNGTRRNGWPVPSLLCSTEQIAENERMWMELLSQGAFDDHEDSTHDPSYGTGATRIGWWQKGWIPIDDDEGGNGHLIDLSPGPTGVYGQILYMDHEKATGCRGPRFSSFAHYLGYAHCLLQAGTHGYSTELDLIEELDYIAYS